MGGALKLLLKIDGCALVRRAALALLASRADEVWVVTGSRHAQVEAALGDLPLQLVRNRNWRQGLSASLRCGLDAVSRAEAPSPTALLVALADQPALHAGLLNALLDLHAQGERIVASDYGEALGPPALFDASLFAALRASEGDQGGRALLRGAHGAVARVPFPEGALDLDTPADLARFREHGACC